MGNIDLEVYDHDLKKSRYSLLYKKSIPNLSRSSKSDTNICGASSDHLLSAPSFEHFDKLRLMALQETALHDSMVLEMGYRMTGYDDTFMLEKDLQNPSASPTLKNRLEEGRDHKKLNPIFLSNLKMGKVHRGRFVSGTLCCKTVKTSTIMNVLDEDGTNDATRLVISNPMHKSITTAKSQLLYPQGANISIHEPYLKCFADGIMGLLVENPADIIFNHVPAKVPSLDKLITKDEIPFQEGAGKVELVEEKNHSLVAGCVGLSPRESLIMEQSTSNHNYDQCLNQNLHTQQIDFDKEHGSSPFRPDGGEGSVTSQLSTPRIGITETPEICTHVNIGNMKVEDRKTSAIVQEDFASPSYLQGSLNLHSLCEPEKSNKEVVENGCGESHKLRDLASSQNSFSQECDVSQPRWHNFKELEQERGNVEGANFVTNVAVEQGEIELIKQVHETLDEKDKYGCKIIDMFDASIDTSKPAVDFTLDKNATLEVKRSLHPIALSGSPLEVMENPNFHILDNSKEGDITSPCVTFIEKEYFMDSRKTLELNKIDGSTDHSHLTSSALRLMGNKHFAQQDWAKAIDLYTQATFKAIQDSVQETKENLSPNQKKIIGYGDPMKDSSHQKGEQESEVVMDYSNRAEAWLRLHQYERAWADSERALSIDPNHLKSLFRKGRALLGLGDYQQALAHFEAANARTQFDKDVLAAIRLSRIADHQNRLGIYDLNDYYLRGRFTGEVPNCADYIGPVQVKANIGDKGRGLFVTKSVEAGDLLLVSNPLAFIQLKSKDKSMSTLHAPTEDSIAYDSNPRMNMEIEGRLAQIMLERAKVSSKNCQRLLALCHAQEGLSHQSAPTMDLFISGKQVLPPLEPVDTNELDDIRLHQIISRNVIDSNMVSTPFVQEKYEDTSINSFYGLWVLPCFINHSCIPNVSMVIVGKCIFVYASRDIPIGEELECSYFNVFQPLHQRRELASRCWSFSCTCARCLLEEKFETSLERLESLHAKIQTNPTFDMRLVIRYLPFRDKNLAQDIAKELKTLHTSHMLDNMEKSWLQASFAKLYIFSRDIIGPQENSFPVDIALRAMEVVSPSSTSTLAVGLLLRKIAERHFGGKKVAKYKVVNQRLLRICRCIFGKHRTNVLQSLVEGLPPHATRKV